MPATVRAVEVNLPEAVLLADLYEIDFDLDAAETFCAKAIALGKETPRDYRTEQGLTEAAVIKYGRCFTEGVRLSLKKKDLAELAEDTVATHDYFFTLRNKFVAHAINAFEETFVTASAREENGKLFPITSVHPGSHRLLLASETAQCLLPLVHSVRKLIKSRIANEEIRLLEFIKSLPLETIHAGDLHSPGRMPVHQVGLSRRHGVRSNKALQPDAPRRR